DHAGRVLHYARGSDTFSSFKLALANSSRADFESDPCHTPHARNSSFDRAARDQFKLGHDLLLVGQPAGHVAPGCAAGRDNGWCRSISRGKRAYAGKTFGIALSWPARVAIAKWRDP